MMEKNELYDPNRFSLHGWARQRPLQFSVAVALVFVLYLTVTGEISLYVRDVSGSIALTYLDESIFRFLFAGAIFLFAYDVLPRFFFGLSLSGLGRGFSLCIALYVLTFLGGFGRLLLADRSTFSMPTVATLIIFPFFMLSVGLAEEFVFRGLILGLLFEKYGTSRRGVAFAALLSGGLFGLVHLMNLTSAPQLIVATISQVIGAAFIGVYFASVYLRCGTLWPVVIVHAMYDFILLGPSLYFGNLASIASTDTEPWQALLSLLVYLPFLIVGLVQLKKVPIHPPLQNERQL